MGRNLLFAGKGRSEPRPLDLPTAVLHGRVCGWLPNGERRVVPSPVLCAVRRHAWKSALNGTPIHLRTSYVLLHLTLAVALHLAVGNDRGSAGSTPDQRVVNLSDHSRAASSSSSSSSSSSKKEQDRRQLRDKREHGQAEASAQPGFDWSGRCGP